MRGSRTVTTALERGRESWSEGQSQRGKGRGGGGGRCERKRKQRGMCKDVVCVYVC